jgi:hypothetical protein
MLSTGLSRLAHRATETSKGAKERWNGVQMVIVDTGLRSDAPSRGTVKSTSHWARLLRTIMGSIAVPEGTWAIRSPPNQKGPEAEYL